MAAEPKAVPLSYNLITLGQPEALITCLESVFASLYQEGDECVVVDTGSKPSELKRLRKGLAKFPNTKLVEAPELSIDYKPLIIEYLGKDVYLKFQKENGRSVGVRSFAEAREVARKNSSNPYLFWIDSDDILVEEEPGSLRKVIDMVFGAETPKLDQILLDYQYNFGPDGAITTLLRRERIVPRETFWWAGACHEVCIPQPNVPTQQVGYFADLRSYIKHTDARKPHFLSDVRNYVLLRRALEEETKTTGKFDPRTLYYLGNSARGLRRFPEAIDLYKKFNLHSGSSDDRFAAMFYVAGMFLDPKVSRPHDAIEYYLECIKIKPHDPRGYLGLQRAYYVLQRFNESLKWYEIGLQHQMPPGQIMSYDPSYINYHPHVLAAFSFKEMGERGLSVECIKKALAARPDHAETKDLVKVFENLQAGQHLANAVRIYGEHSGLNPQSLVADLPGVPEELERMGLGRPEQEEGRAPKPEIVFYCPGSLEEWGPSARKGGIGGSEKMTIILSEALQASGKVNASVYANVPIEERGVNADTGVAWFHWSQFDEKRPRYAVVFWRDLEAIHRLNVPAKYRIAWCHDVQNPARYTPELLSKYDHIQVQSAFHGAPIAGLVGEKLWVARNALEVPKDRGIERNPKQVLYCSSPDRGLLTAAAIVREAQKTDPEIKLVVTYGITPWARKLFAQAGTHRWVPDVNHQMCMDLYERTVHGVLDEIGAVRLNRIGFEEMETLMQASGVWLYPTRFPEISCMSAMEAQANGAACLATRYGALATTLLPEANLLATHVPALPDTQELPEGYVQAVARQLVETCQVPPLVPLRNEQAAAAIAAFNVQDLAENWLMKLGLSDAVESAIDVSAKAPVLAAELPSTTPKEQLVNFVCDLDKAEEILNADRE